MRPLSSLLPTRATHGRCVLCHLCREWWRGCAQVCTVRFRLCTVCTVCRMSWALTAVFSECFAKCAHICRMCRTLSQNSTRLGIRLTTRTSCARVRKKQLRTGFQPVEQKRNRRQIRELFPSGAVRGRIWPDLAKSGAPAAILINAYSGDFCHPVLSNALAQEPLVYHSGTRELFSDIFGTFSEISTFSRFWANLTKTVKNWKTCQKTNFHVRTLLQKRIHKRANVQNRFHSTKLSAHKCKRQMCKCANVRKTVVHKMRKSAAQIFFQMQKCTNLQIRKSALCTISVMQVLCNYYFSVQCFCVKFFLCVT